MSWKWLFRSGLTVGITSRSPESDLKWLMDLLKSGDFQGHVSEVKYLPITNGNSSEWKMEVGKCSAGILYHSKRWGRINITDGTDSLYDQELSYMSETLGQQKVIVVLDNFEKTDEDEKIRILETQPSIRKLSRELFLIPETHKYEAVRETCDYVLAALKGAKGKPPAGRPSEENRTSPKSPLPEHSNHLQPSETLSNNDSMQGYHTPVQQTKTSVKFPWADVKQKIASCTKSTIKGMKTLITQISPDKVHSQVNFPSLPSGSQNHKVTIFSRSPESNYKWLISQLQSKNSGDLVTDVRAVFISDNYSKFLSELSDCTFAILYHTLNHGRINITDVTDALYDRELEDLYQTLGKDNVIVVIDDLKDSSDKEKNQILQSQPSIRSWAMETFIFSEQEKSHKTRSSSSDYMVDNRRHLEKLQRLKEIITKSGQPDAAESPGDQSLPQSPSGSGDRSRGGQKHPFKSATGDYGEPDAKKRPRAVSHLRSQEPSGSAVESHSDSDSSEAKKIPEDENSLRSRHKKNLERIGTLILAQRDENLKRKWEEFQEIEKDWQRFIQGLIQEKESQIQEQEGNIQEQEGNMQEQEGNIQEQEGNMQEQEGNMQEQEGNIQEQEGNMQEQEGNIQEQEGNMQEQEGNIQEQEGNMQEQEGNIPEQEGNMQEQEGNIQEQEGNMQEQEGNIQEQEGNIQEQEGNMQEQEGNMQEQEGNIREQEGNMQEQEGNIQEQEGNMQE
ncbi:uncharacterized protein O3C94_018912 [Discoglossus pictus]